MATPLTRSAKTGAAIHFVLNFIVVLLDRVCRFQNYLVPPGYPVKPQSEGKVSAREHWPEVQEGREGTFGIWFRSSFAQEKGAPFLERPEKTRILNTALRLLFLGRLFS